MPVSKKKTEVKQKQTEESSPSEEKKEEQVSREESEEVTTKTPKKETTSSEIETSSLPSASDVAAKPVSETRNVQWPSSQSVGAEAASAQSQVSPVAETQTPSDQPKEGSEASETVSEERPIVVTSEKKNNLLIFIVLIILGLALGAGLFFFRGALGKIASQVTKQTGIKKEKAVPTVSRQEPTVAPSPTPEKVDLSKYSITVLNGSGIKGEAAKLKEMLEEEGFSVASVGNADASDYEKTILKVKEGTETGFLDKLKSALGTSYVLASTQTLEKNDKNEVVIVIGSEKAE